MDFDACMVPFKIIRWVATFVIKVDPAMFLKQMGCFLFSLYMSVLCLSFLFCPFRSPCNSTLCWLFREYLRVTQAGFVERACGSVVIGGDRGSIGGRTVEA